MVDVAAAFYSNGGDRILLPGLGDLRGAIGRGCGKPILGYRLEGDRLGCANADDEGSADADAAPVT